RDGTLLVAWFSDRGSNSDIYLTSTRDGATWSGPARVTTSPDGDFYPNLFQDAAGTFHLVWFRWDAPFHGHIWTNSSVDGVTWDPAKEVQVTSTANVDDWVPTIAQAADGTLLIYFVSAKRDSLDRTNGIYVAKQPRGQATWDTAVPAAGINST